MSLKPLFQKFADLLGELCPEHSDVQPWVDRPDLATEVRDLWSCVGLSRLSAKFAPRATPAAETERLVAVFEEWFESAIVRDRWCLEPEDEPVPWRLLPPAPRLLERAGNRILIASDVGEMPKVFSLVRSHPLLVERAFTVSRWGMYELLRVGSMAHRGGLVLGPDLHPHAAIEGLDLPLEHVGDGVYLLGDLEAEPAKSKAVLYRSLGHYIRYVLALPEDAQGHFSSPDGTRVVFLRTKRCQLNPQGTAVPAGFRRILGTQFQAKPPYDQSLVGEVGGCSVWLEGGGAPNMPVFAHCDAADAEQVKAGLVSLGAKVQKVEVTTHTPLPTGWRRHP